jgi:hypothetical protein
MRPERRGRYDQRKIQLKGKNDLTQVCLSLCGLEKVCY